MSAFIQFKGVPGESQDEDHKEWTDINTFNWGMSRSIEGGAEGVKRRQGSTNVHDISITRVVDKSSVKLAQACVDGTCFDEVHLHLCNQVGGAEVPYLTYKMTYVIITSHQIAGTEGDVPSEALTLNFQAVSWNYAVEKEDGSVSGNIPGEYDPKKN
jgi:type VI secretion system secreted protein Hcp